MRIEVTQDDIDKGLPIECSDCPIARSVSKALGGKVVFVRPSYIVIDSNIVKLPEEAKNFIEDFDYGDKVHPFSFDLEIE